MDVLMPLIVGVIAAGAIWLSAHFADKKREKKQTLDMDQIEIDYED